MVKPRREKQQTLEATLGEKASPPKREETKRREAKEGMKVALLIT